MSPWGDVAGEMLERLYHSAGLVLGVPPEDLVEVAAEGSVWISLFRPLPHATSTGISGRKRDKARLYIGMKWEPCFHGQSES